MTEEDSKKVFKQLALYVHQGDKPAIDSLLLQYPHFPAEQHEGILMTALVYHQFDIFWSLIKDHHFSTENASMVLWRAAVFGYADIVEYLTQAQPQNFKAHDILLLEETIRANQDKTLSYLFTISGDIDKAQLVPLSTPNAPPQSHYAHLALEAGSLKSLLVILGSAHNQSIFFTSHNIYKTQTLVALCKWFINEPEDCLCFLRLMRQSSPSFYDECRRRFTQDATLLPEFIDAQTRNQFQGSSQTLFEKLNIEAAFPAVSTGPAQGIIQNMSNSDKSLEIKKIYKI